MVSIEHCDDSAVLGLTDRIRRKRFYQKNGYTDIGYLIELAKTQEEILIKNGYLIELAKTQEEILIKNGVFDQEEFSGFFKKYSDGSMKSKIWKK